MIPLVGYSDRLSARPGETIAFKVSSHLDAPYDAHLVRIISADPNPEGPGIVEEDLSAIFAASYASRAQPFAPGSYARSDTEARFPDLSGITLLATIWPTLPSARDGRGPPPGDHPTLGEQQRRAGHSRPW